MEHRIFVNWESIESKVYTLSEEVPDYRKIVVNHYLSDYFLSYGDKAPYEILDFELRLSLPFIYNFLHIE